MQLPEPTCQQIQIAGYLHDIGKVYIPLSILEKEGELDDEELSQVREHSYMTGELLSDYSELGDIINWASNHHEKMDGNGYPLHLEKEHLTLADRIISIADIFTALTEDRPYRKGMAWQEALQIMEADVINGALDSDVFSFCATMRKRYTPSFFRPLPLCIASAASEAGRRRGGGGVL